MLMRRIVVCLDVRGGRVVKGVRFQGLRDVGDPAELAGRYEEEGADEIVFLDISASAEQRATLLESVRRTAQSLFVPLTVGGGVRTIEDIARALRSGADKVSFNTAAVADPSLIPQAAERFGAQCVVVSIDARREPEAGRPSGWRVYTHGGSVATALDPVTWAQECVHAGAGEILLTSIDRDGTRTGYDLPLIRAVANVVDVPVVASGGAGTATHVCEAFLAGADAALIAGIVHDGSTSVSAIKSHVAQRSLPVRDAA
ncbi:MAG TPA: imidazole glycerol phosphate synthase subunit HisF [Gemmatimonadaceae bacterium]|nr:imidazole glycerol phosphate synthase subunit HisF [Gemmatimonadaceae bacterium]